MATSSTHSLENTWTFWEIKTGANEKSYGNSFRSIADFSTIEKFWEVFLSMPRASEIFGDGTRKVLVEGREVKALCLFKKGITPEWEDERNRDGAEFNAVKVLTPEALDAHWENIVYALIGEVLDEEENICGVRLVHQGKKMKGGFKFEVWLRKRDEEIANKIKVKLAEVLVDSNEKLKPSFRFSATDFAGWVLHSSGH